MFILHEGRVHLNSKILSKPPMELKESIYPIQMLPHRPEFPSKLTKDIYLNQLTNTTRNDELVMAIDTTRFTNALRNKNNHRLEKAFDKPVFIPRSWAEYNPGFIQIIPYVTFHKHDSVFVYQRSKGIGENRLLGKKSVGIGGHINLRDMFKLQDDDSFIQYGLKDIIFNAVKREIKEEISLICDSFEKDFEIDEYTEKTMVNKMTFYLDHSAAKRNVNYVHLVAYTSIKIPENFDIKTKEEENVSLGFIDFMDINKNHFDDFEDWSKDLLSSRTNHIACELNDEKFYRPHTNKLPDDALIRSFGIKTENKNNVFFVGYLSAACGKF